MKILGIDYGTKRIGLALCLTESGMVLPHSTIAALPREHLFKNLCKIIEREGVDAIVLGLPLDESGKETDSTLRVKDFLRGLKAHTTLPIYLVEEAYTTVEAIDKLRKRGMSMKKIKKVVDQVAAMEILNHFLRMHQQGHE